MASEVRMGIDSLITLLAIEVLICTCDEGDTTSCLAPRAILQIKSSPSFKNRKPRSASLALQPRSIVIFRLSSGEVRGRSAIPTCETMLSRSRLGACDLACGATLVRPPAARELLVAKSPENEPD